MAVTTTVAVVAESGCASHGERSSEGASAEARASATVTPSSAPARKTLGTFLERRRQHRTELRRRAPITDTWPTFADPPSGAERVTFSSDGRELWGWYAAPPRASSERRVPALVYFHGHFFLKPKDFERLRPFLDAGFAVLTPTLRGRNGNPGDHELLYGEVDDARAAVAFVASRPEVDPARIYTFGHSMGGGTSALLSFYPDLPVRMTGGCGAVYSTETWESWASGGDSDLVRFDPADPDEAELRVLLPHAAELVHPHYAYMGDREVITRRNALAVQKKARAAGRAFEVEVVPGGHAEAIEPALARWFEVLRADSVR